MVALVRYHGINDAYAEVPGPDFCRRGGNLTGRKTRFAFTALAWVVFASAGRGVTSCDMAVWVPRRSVHPLTPAVSAPLGGVAVQGEVERRRARRGIGLQVVQEVLQG